MNLANRRYCDSQLLRFLKEEDLKREDGSNATISVTTYKNKEQMIFLGKADDGKNFEVRVYKANPRDRYIRNTLDKCVRVIENDEYATFVFEQFQDMLDFVKWLHYRHVEFIRRPLTRHAK